MQNYLGALPGGNLQSIYAQQCSDPSVLNMQQGLNATPPLSDNNGVQSDLNFKPQLLEDTCEFSSQVTVNNGADTKKKALIAGGIIGAAALIAGGIFLHKKISGKTVKQLAEKIEFKEADNIDDAIKFAKEQLGIKKIKGFGKEDLGALNWTNEGLSNINNMHKGKAVMPKSIEYVEGLVGAGNTKAAAAIGLENDCLSISKDFINETKNDLIEFVNKMEGTPEEKAKFLSRYEKNFKNVMRDTINITKLNGGLKSTKSGCSEFLSELGYIYHEMGHLQHIHNIPMDFFKSLGKASELSEWNVKVTEEGKALQELFKNSKDTVKRVSGYSTESPAEFVAETYARALSFGKINKDVYELYTKLGGVNLLGLSAA